MTVFGRISVFGWNRPPACPIRPLAEWQGRRAPGEDARRDRRDACSTLELPKNRDAPTVFPHDEFLSSCPLDRYVCRGGSKHPGPPVNGELLIFAFGG